MKKALSLLLSALMLITSISAVSYAEDGSSSAIKDTFSGAYDNSGLTGGTTYYVGNVNSWNDYTVANSTEHDYNRYKNGRTNVVINDWNAYDDNWGGINTNTWDITVTPNVSITQRNYGGKAWGYMGKYYNAQWTKKYTSSNGSYIAATDEELAPTWDKVPDDKWGNCFDITDYVDNGYMVYELDNVKGDTKNAYLAITSAWTNWCLAFSGGSVPKENASLNKTDNDNLMSVVPYASGVYGVRLEDYYDVAVGGKQIVKVPIKDFVRQNAQGCGGENSTFSEAYMKNWTKESYYTGGVGRAFKPNFFNGAGIARQDSGEGKTFSAEIIKIAIVEPAEPTELAAKATDNGIYLKWTASADSDVSYEIIRNYMGQTTTLSAGKETSFTDTTATAGKGYTYTVVAVDDTYGIRSAESNAVTLESTGVGEIFENFAIEDTWESTKDGQKPEYETWPTPLGVGPYKSGTAINFNNDYYTHAVNGKINAHGRPRTYYIHDMYYGNTQNASITYRPQNEGEADYYASEVDQFWGYNGVLYRNNTAVPGYIKNFADIQGTGYAVYDIKLEDGSSADGAYLAIAHVCTSLAPWASGHYWNIIGVPLADYYDVEKGGFQQVCVPLADFDVEDPDVFSVFIDNNATTTGGRHEFDKKPLNMAAFGGMGILRKDSRGIGVYDIDKDDLKTTAKPFAYSANGLYLAEVQTPEQLEATLTDDGIKLDWFESSTMDVTDYQILRDGNVIGEVSQKTTYTDTTAQPGFSYTYGVRAVSPTFEQVYSKAVTATAKIPNGAEVMIYAHNNGREFESKLTYEGKMTAKFYAKEPATGYIACYDKDGRLKSAGMANVKTGEWASASVENCEKTDVIKTFLWDSEGKPLADSKVTETKTTLKILAIGNSYSQNATSQLHQIAKADGVEIDVTNMYIGGCSLETHWQNISGDLGAYELHRNGSWTNDYNKQAKVSQLLAEDDWDIITVQQASWYSVDYKTFEPYLSNILEYLTEVEPNADVIFHQTWEYSEEHCWNTFQNPNLTSKIMCERVLENSRKAAKTINEITGSPMRIIPSGMAVRGVIETDPDYVLWSDGTHMNTAGCYLVGLVWYKTLAGGDIMNNKYTYSGLSQNEIDMFKACADSAVNAYSIVE